MNIRQKIQSVITVIIFALMITVCITASVNSYRSTLSVVESNLSQSVKTATTTISDKMSIYLNTAQATALDSVFTGSASSSAKAALIEKYAALYGFSSGNILNVSGKSIINGTDFSDRDYVVKALNGEANISDMSISKLTNKYGVSVATPIHNSFGKVIGVLYYRLDNDFFTNIINEFTLTENTYAFITDSSGTIIAHPNSDLEGNTNISSVIPNSKVISSVLSDSLGVASYGNKSNQIFVAYAPIDNTNGWHMAIVSPVNDYTAAVIRMIILLVIILVISQTIALIIAGQMSKYISKCIRRVEAAILKISEGNFDIELDTTKSKDELGILQNATVSLISTLTSIIGEANDVLGAISEYDLTKGNLKEYPGSFNSLAESVNKINSILRKLIRTVKTASGEVGNGAEQLADATNLLSQGTVTQANSLSTVVIEIDNITAAISQSSENGEMINERLQHLDKEIHEGNSQMSELLSAVQQANEMTTDIKKIVSNIDSIAFQTNILALNASVEAAHAGQMGRGFAVVAEEVRDLATKCAEASGETKELIEQCVRAIDKARNSAEITSSSLNSINENSTNISNAFVEISNATSSQAKKTKDIQSEINNIADVVQSNTATSQEIAASTTELSEQANNLKKMINKFVL